MSIVLPVRLLPFSIIWRLAASKKGTDNGRDVHFLSRAQYAVLQHLGVKKLFAVVGFSMGGQQVSNFVLLYLQSSRS